MALSLYSSRGPVIIGKPVNNSYKIIEVAVKGKKNHSEMHEHADDIYFVLEGKAKLTLGGRLTKKQKKSPGEWRGESISNGKTRTITKGDIISIPRRTAHMVDAAHSQIRYAVVKIY